MDLHACTLARVREIDRGSCVSRPVIRATKWGEAKRVSFELWKTTAKGSRAKNLSPRPSTQSQKHLSDGDSLLSARVQPVLDSELALSAPNFQERMTKQFVQQVLTTTNMQIVDPPDSCTKSTARDESNRPRLTWFGLFVELE